MVNLYLAIPSGGDRQTEGNSFLRLNLFAILHRCHFKDQLGGSSCGFVVSLVDHNGLQFDDEFCTIRNVLGNLGDRAVILNVINDSFNNRFCLFRCNLRTSRSLNNISRIPRGNNRRSYLSLVRFCYGDTSSSKAVLVQSNTLEQFYSFGGVMQQGHSAAGSGNPSCLCNGGVNLAVHQNTAGTVVVLGSRSHIGCDSSTVGCTVQVQFEHAGAGVGVSS